jgi:hypothetical protein
METFGMKVLVTLVAVALGSACVGPFSELQERQYQNTDAARAADPSGWIPAILPNDATSIREVHKVDESRTWGCFSTRQSDEVRALLSGLNGHKAPGPIGNRPAEIFRDFSWWPESMAGNALEAWEFREEGRCPACGATVVRVGIDVRNSTVCFHRKT